MIMPTPGPLLFGMLPIALWAWLSRSPRTGVAVGAILVALLAWFVVPRALWASGSWVPSEAESYWLYAVFAAMVCVIACSCSGSGRGGCSGWWRWPGWAW